MFTFLEWLGVLFILFILTQVILPFMTPRSFEYFWAFKRKKKLEEKVDEALELKNQASQKINEVKDLAEENLKTAKEFNKQIKTKL